MAKVTLELPGQRYDIVIDAGLLGGLGGLVKSAVPSVANGGRAALFTDENVEIHHARATAKAMQDAGLDTVIAAFPCGERFKTLGTMRKLYEVLLDAKLERGHPVVALGGGIVGDVAGFVAATYLRGVPFVQVPTTLLAMVDASVGGKTGVNMPQGKNLIGAFWQPDAVFADVETLKTLPMRELRCGLAECVKHGVIRDPALFHWIDEHAQDILTLHGPTLIELVRRNVEIKARVVMADEREAGERAHLNFGHTFAHAIEATAKYGTTYHHGEAVALGMVAAARVSHSLGLCDAALATQIIALLDKLGLPTSAPLLANASILMKAMGHDKKVQHGKVRLILPTRLGEVVMRSDTPAVLIADAWESLRQASKL